MSTEIIVPPAAGLSATGIHHNPFTRFWRWLFPPSDLTLLAEMLIHSLQTKDWDLSPGACRNHYHLTRGDIVIRFCVGRSRLVFPKGVCVFRAQIDHEDLFQNTFVLNSVVAKLFGDKIKPDSPSLVDAVKQELAKFD